MLRFVKRFVVCLSVLGCLAVTPTQADADQIQFNSSAIVTSLVTVGGTIGSNYHGQVQAGQLAWTWVGTPPEGFAQSFYSYCVDLAHFVTSTQEVTPVSSTGFTNGVTDGGTKAAWLFNQYAAGIFDLGNTALAAINAAALQLAIWEAMYDTSANLAYGGFTATGSSAVINQATTYLNALYSSNMTAVATVLSTTRLTGQDQIVAQVSEPSTLLIMGLAFFGFAMLARRRTTITM